MRNSAMIWLSRGSVGDVMMYPTPQVVRGDRPAPGGGGQPRPERSGSSVERCLQAAAQRDSEVRQPPAGLPGVGAGRWPVEQVARPDPSDGWAMTPRRRGELPAGRWNLPGWP